MDLNKLDELLRKGIHSKGYLTVLSGAGISAESGIPTFRGPEGYWTVGSAVYHPQEMATHAMFERDPKSVWGFYLHRYAVCRQAQPNEGHFTLAAMEKMMPDRFLLVTQNVDGLHLRAGQSPARTYQIHGNLSFVRCAAACTKNTMAMPQGLLFESRSGTLTKQQWRRLHCPGCGALLRPHVLWFDECYDEGYYRFESTLKAARATSLLIVVGTSGATNLPSQVFAEAIRRQAVIIDINIDENPFGQLAENYPSGMSIRQSSTQALPLIRQRLEKVLKS